MAPMLGWENDARTRASRSNRARRSACVSQASGRILMATSRPSAASRARKTSPIPPAPISSTILYGPSLVPAAMVIVRGHYRAVGLIDSALEQVVESMASRGRDAATTHERRGSRRYFGGAGCFIKAMATLHKPEPGDSTDI